MHAGPTLSYLDGVNIFFFETLRASHYPRHYSNKNMRLVGRARVAASSIGRPNTHSARDALPLLLGLAGRMPRAAAAASPNVVVGGMRVGKRSLAFFWEEKDAADKKDAKDQETWHKKAPIDSLVLSCEATSDPPEGGEDAGTAGETRVVLSAESKAALRRIARWFDYDRSCRGSTGGTNIDSVDADAVIALLERRMRRCASALGKKGSSEVFLGIGSDSLVSPSSEGSEPIDLASSVPELQCLDRIAVVNVAGRSETVSETGDGQTKMKMNKKKKYLTDPGDGFGGHELRELVRRSAATSVRQLCGYGAQRVGVAPLGGFSEKPSIDAAMGFLTPAESLEAAAEGARLGQFKFDELKKSERKGSGVEGDGVSSPASDKRVSLVPVFGEGMQVNTDAWTRGAVMADCQDVARRLAGTVVVVE
jgi:hypothetical protein